MLAAVRFCGLLLLTFFAIDAARAADSPNAPRIEDLCKTLWKDCRHNVLVQFRQADGSEYKQTFPLAPPPVQNKTLMNIFVGETLHLAAKVDGDRIVELTTATAKDDPSHVIEITLNQQPGKPDVLLGIKNPFDRQLKYKASIVVPPQNGPTPTSVCSVVGGKIGIESWPYPVFQALLSDFRFLPSTEPAVPQCE